MTVFKFRALIIAGVALSIAGLIFDLWLSPTLPDHETWELSTLGVVIILGVTVALLVLTIVLTVGLYFFRWWAPIGFLITTIMWLIGLAFVGQSEITGIAAMCYDASNLLNGAVLAAAYWSSINSRFRRPGQMPLQEL